MNENLTYETNDTVSINSDGILSWDTDTSDWTNFNGTHYCSIEYTYTYKFYIQHKQSKKFYKDTKYYFNTKEWILNNNRLVGKECVEIAFTDYLKDAQILKISSTSKPSDTEVLEKIGLSNKIYFDVICVSEECENYYSTDATTVT